MATYETLAEAMDAKDDLAEVELRYRLLAETFEAVPNLRANLNPALERAKAEILRLRAVKTGDTTGEADSGKVVPFDASRFHKAGT